MTDNELAAFYRRYNACCNEHRVEDLAEFVARDVAIDGVIRGLDAYAAELPRRWEPTTEHSAASRRPVALSPSRSSRSTG